MMSLLESILFFLPVFFIINLVAAVPGRESLREALRLGLRHFTLGTAVLVAISIALYFLMGWLILTPPLW